MEGRNIEDGMCDDRSGSEEGNGGRRNEMNNLIVRQSQSNSLR